jgi:hypothetical protein
MFLTSPALAHAHHRGGDDSRCCATDFQLIWVLTRGGPANATHLIATLGYQRAIGGGYLGEGSAIAAVIPFHWRDPDLLVRTAATEMAALA